MNAATVMVRLAALRGKPIPVSTHAAPLDAEGSTMLPPSKADQISPPRAGLTSTRNIVYAHVAGKDGASLALRMDVIVPVHDRPLPLVVFVPGGGFMVAPKAAGGRSRRYVAQAGYAVASIEYRTVRHEATYVDGVADVKASIRFLRANAARFGIDPMRVALWGESAGGYLAAMAAVSAGDPRFDQGDLLGESSLVQAVVDKFGGSDLSQIAAGFDEATVAANRGAHTAFARYVFGPEGRLDFVDDPSALADADPASQARSTVPPFLIFHGTNDRIISPVQTAHLHRALRAAGAASERYLLEDAGHGDLAVTSGEEKYWSTEAVMRMTVDFLDRTLTSPAA
jgi:acetyl esterase/lipase